MKAVIFGGGLAGLSAGKILSENAVDVVLFERNNIVDGLARSFTRDGCTCDLGVYIGKNGLFRYNNMDHSIGMGVPVGEKITCGGHKGIQDKIKQIGIDEDFVG